MFGANGTINQTIPHIYATWNPAVVGTGYTLSNGNLTASGHGSYLTVATIGKSSGKWYWEIANQWAGAGYIGYSLAASPSNWLAIPGSAAGGGQLTGWWSSGNWWSNGNQGTALATYAVDVLGFAHDADAGTLKVYKNGVLADTRNVGAGAAVWPCVGGSDVTANFGASAFTYSPPGGYNAGLYN